MENSSRTLHHFVFEQQPQNLLQVRHLKLFKRFEMGNSSSSSNTRVVIVGAGYGGTAAAKALDDKCKVTLIESQDAFMHRISSIRGAIVPGWEKRVRVPLDKLLKNGKLIQADVASVKTGVVTLKDGSTIEADYIILAHGGGFTSFPTGELPCFVFLFVMQTINLYLILGLTPEITNSSEYVSRLVQKQAAIASANSILIVGGGPTGVEFAGTVYVIDCKYAV